MTWLDLNVSLTAGGKRLEELLQQLKLRQQERERFDADVLPFVREQLEPPEGSNPLDRRRRIEPIGTRPSDDTNIIVRCEYEANFRDRTRKSLFGRDEPKWSCTAEEPVLVDIRSGSDYDTLSFRSTFADLVPWTRLTAWVEAPAFDANGILTRGKHIPNPVTGELFPRPVGFLTVLLSYEPYVLPRCPDGKQFTLNSPIVMARIYARREDGSMSRNQRRTDAAGAAFSSRLYSWDARTRTTRQLIVDGQEVGDRVIEIEPYPSLGEQVIQVSTLDEADTLVLFQ
jgi:hypothetical protein